MNYEQLIEELREEMLQLVNTKCDALLQMYRSGEMHTDKRDTIRESSLITVSPAELKGKRPLAVQFAPGEWIETPTWRKVAQKILQTCNEQPDIHERFMEMDCQHFFRQIFLGYFSDIVQAFDTLRKNVCGDDYTSLHNPIVLSSVLPAYGMFHSIQILFL